MEETTISKKILDFLKDFGISGIDHVRGVVSEYIDEQVQIAVQEEKNVTILMAVEALMEEEVEEDRIYDLLERYFNVDSRSEARSLIQESKIDRKCMEYKTYLLSLGLNLKDVVFPRNEMEKKLKENPKLLDESVENLDQMCRKQ